MSDQRDGRDERDQGRDTGATRRYRSAVETVDERPSAAIRAAILAAAAREVGAQPRSADAVMPLQPPRPSRPPQRRWPLAAAAAVLLSTLAVMLAVRTEREMPTFSAPPSESAERASPQAAPGTGATRPEDAPAQSAAARPAPAQPAAAQPAAAPDPVNSARQTLAERAAAFPAAPSAKVRQERDRGGAERTGQEAAAPDGPASVPVPQRADSAEALSSLGKQTAVADSRTGPPLARSAEPVARAGDATSPSAGAAAPSGAAAAGSTADAPRVNAEAKRRDEARPKDERERQLAAGAPAAATPMNSAPARLDGMVELSAAEWLKKIVALRAQGRDEQADEELRKFRAKYPALVVPPEALARAVTR